MSDIVTKEEVNLEDEDAVLQVALKHRFDIVNHITSTKEYLKNEDLLKVHMDNLSGIEKVALARKKIKSDESIGKGNEEIAMAIASAVLNQTMQKENRWLVHDPATTRDLPSLPDGVEAEFTIDEKEMRPLGGRQLDVKTFTEMYKEKNKD